MSYPIVGFGNFAEAHAKAFARKDIQVSIATTPDSESFASAAAAIGHVIIPKTLVDAVKADMIFVTVRFGLHPDGANARPSSQGK